VLSIESGPEWVANLFMAERGELDAPYVITWEGSVMDESLAGDGYWMGLGEDPETGRQITSLEWLDRLAPGPPQVVAIGTCARGAGIPAAEKQSDQTQMGVMDHLGKDYRSAFGVPVVNVPGMLTHWRQLLGNRRGRAALSSGPRPASGVRRARAPRVALRRHSASPLSTRWLLRG
jgi:Ni,Fe-hydrogenase I small subunit